MATTPLASIFMFLVAAFFGVLGQYFYKSGAELATGGVISYVANPRLILGIVCYLAVMVLFMAAFKRGGSMATLYPIYASTFVWGTIISHFAFGTEIRLVNILGMALIGFGMFCLGL
jgi:multidrug transporter EmrE-like cation transporter